MTDHAINTVIAIAAGIFFATITRMLSLAGADLWAAIVLGLAAVAALLTATGAWARLRS